MWPWSEVALLREQLRAAELRYSVAQAALAAAERLADERYKHWETALAERARAIDAAEAERKEHRQSERHLVSMFLRREKTFPLPQTPEEKAEAKEQAEEANKRPPKLTDVELAMRDANRKDAAMNGISEEDADRHFMNNRHLFIDD